MISVALSLEFFIIIIINHSSKTVSRIFRIYNILKKTNKMVSFKWTAVAGNLENMFNWCLLKLNKHKIYTLFKDFYVY